jgi:hypothetical protein
LDVYSDIMRYGPQRVASTQLLSSATHRPSHVNHGSCARGGVLLYVITDKRPELAYVDNGGVGPVPHDVELTHTDLTEVTRVVFVEKGTVMVLATSLTTATRVLTMFTDTAVAGTDVRALLAVLVKTGRL